MAVQPAVHSVSQRLWEDVGQAFWRPDEAEGTNHQWQLLRYVDAAVRYLGTVEDLIRDSDEGLGWSALLDVDRVPVQWLPFLAQFIGAAVPPGLTEAEQRAAVQDAEGWRRGTPAAIMQAAKSLLTGDQKVNLLERDGGAYRLHVQTYEAHTPNPVGTEAAIRRAKPAGLVLTYTLLPGELWGTVKAGFATWADVKAAFATWGDLRSWIAP